MFDMFSPGTRVEAGGRTFLWGPGLPRGDNLARRHQGATV